MSRRTVLLAIAFPVVLVTLVAGVGVVVLDQRAAKKLSPGTFIEGVDVGGLRYDEAVAQVRAAVEDPLHRQVDLSIDSFSVRTTPWDLGYRVDVPAAVHRAIASGRGDNVLSRVSAQLSSGGAPSLSLQPKWGPGTLDRVIADAGKAVATPAKDAEVDVSTGWVKIVPEKSGKAIDVEASKRAVMDAVRLGGLQVKLVTRPVKGTTDPLLSKVILVRAGENNLYLYENGQIVKQWPVATGAKGYLTPQGVWQITQKLVNPSWHNPGSAWAKSLPPVIGPGPNNPLGTKALRLNAPAILIHATSKTSSIGYSESHGCIRMNEADEAELFSMVPVGTRVAVVQVLPPRPIGSAPIDATAF